MERTVYNPQKGRHETLDITINETTTTWFNDSLDVDSIYMIADTDDGLLIQETGYSYPALLYDLTRVDIAFDPQRAKALLKNIS